LQQEQGTKATVRWHAEDATFYWMSLSEIPLLISNDSKNQDIPLRQAKQKQRRTG
jgi:hypothetical protein